MSTKFGLPTQQWQAVPLTLQTREQCEEFGEKRTRERVSLTCMGYSRQTVCLPNETLARMNSPKGLRPGLSQQPLTSTQSKPEQHCKNSERSWHWRLSHKTRAGPACILSRMAARKDCLNRTQSLITKSPQCPGHSKLKKKKSFVTPRTRTRETTTAQQCQHWYGSEVGVIQQGSWSSHQKNAAVSNYEYSWNIYK